MADQGESSKVSKKRQKRDKQAIVAALRNVGNRGIRIGGSNNFGPSQSVSYQGPSEETSQGTPNSSPKEKKYKKTRGPTTCKTMGQDGEKPNVYFNERGQPIDQVSEKLSLYLGTIGRQMVPITYDDWRDVQGVRKYLIWEAIKQKFTLDEQRKAYCMRTVGRLWRSYKTRLRGIIDRCKSNAMVLEKKPKNIDSKDWKNSIRGKSSSRFVAKSKKFKRMRSKQVLPYTASRKGYARVENDMKKISDNPSSIVRVDILAKALTKAKIQALKKSAPLNSIPLPLKEDMLSQLLGSERHGQVRGFRFGVTPTRLGIVSQTTGRVAELEEQLAVMNRKMEDMASLISKLISN